MRCLGLGQLVTYIIVLSNILRPLVFHLLNSRIIGQNNMFIQFTSDT